MPHPNGDELDEKDYQELDLEMLREDLVGELQAINQYEAHIDMLDSDEARAVLEHIRDDEKEHVAELTKLIQKLDPVQKAKFKKEGERVTGKIVAMLRGVRLVQRPGGIRGSR